MTHLILRLMFVGLSRVIILGFSFCPKQNLLLMMLQISLIPLCPILFVAKMPLVLVVAQLFQVGLVACSLVQLPPLILFFVKERSRIIQFGMSVSFMFPQLEAMPQVWNDISLLVFSLKHCVLLGDFIQVKFYEDKLGGSRHIRGWNHS